MQVQSKLHLGCGAIILPGWLNVDINPGPGGVQCDLTKPLRMASATVDYVFNEHFLEHLDRAQGVALLRECYRVLRKGGVLRIITPDLQVLMTDYVTKNLERVKEVWRPATPAQMFNEGMRLWGHQFVYDADELVLVLREAGFTMITRADYKQSMEPALIGIDQRPHHEELIFEAMK